MGELGTGFRVDDDGFSFQAEDGLVLDVLFDDRRVWSLASDDFPPDGSGTRSVSWPLPIRKRLEGAATVELREHATGATFAVTEASFGKGDGRVLLVDSAGRPLAVTKWGRLNRPFSTLDRDVVDAYLDQVEQVLSVLRDECGVPAFLAFGSLLGAVREGKLIGHDVDVDLGYFSRHEHPADVIREGFRIERVLRSRGYEPVRENGGFLAIFLPQPDGTRRNLDIFTAFCCDGMLYQVHDVTTPGSEADVLPLRTIHFEGRRIPVPSRPEVFLEAAYGPSWRVPNPAFQFNPRRLDRRRIHGWFGGLRERRDFWSRHYAAEGRRIPETPSPFARWVAEREPAGRLFDVGCGNGRDTRFFVAHGYDVTPLDLLPRASRRVLGRLPAHTRPQVQPFNLQSLRQALATGGRASFERRPVTVYGRFLLHALSDYSRENFWRFTSMALSGGGRCYLEFRTDRDATLPKAFGRHFRRFLSPEAVAAEARAAGGRVVHTEAGRSMSPFENEDPHLCRMIVEWKP